MGIRDTVHKIVAEWLRPWLLCDVSPIVNFGASFLDVHLPHLEINPLAINSFLESSPLLLKEAINVQDLHLIMAPFRMPVFTVSIHGLHLVLRPRPVEESWWETKRQKSEEQQRMTFLSALDPQGTSAHNVAQKRSEAEISNTWLIKFLLGILFSCVRMELLDSLAQVVSHASNCQYHAGTVSLRSFIVEEKFNGGLTCSGGLSGSICSAFYRAWKKASDIKSKYCSTKGLGLHIETWPVEGAHSDSRSNCSAGNELDPKLVDSAHTVMSPLSKARKKELRHYAVLLDDMSVDLSFCDLSLKSLELAAPVVDIALDSAEFFSLKVLATQLQGSAGTADIGRGDRKFLPDEEITCKRSAVNLWKIGIQKAVGLSSRRQLKLALLAGVVRRRYSSLYESWLLELGWGHKRDGDAETVGSRQRIDDLWREILEVQKDLPVEAIALARRVARHRISANVHARRDPTNSRPEGPSLHNTRKPFLKNFLGLFWQGLSAFCYLSMDGSSQLLMYAKAAKKIFYQEWKQVWSAIKALNGAGARDQASCDDSASATQCCATSAESSGPSTCGKDYFQLRQSIEDENEIVSGTSNVTFAFRCAQGSVMIAAISDSQNNELNCSHSVDHREKQYTSIPAICLKWERFLIAYGLNFNSKLSLTCGNLHGEVLSLCVSEVPKEHLVEQDIRDISKERWEALPDRASLFSSFPCQSRIIKALKDRQEAKELCDAHMNWQDRRVKLCSEMNWHKSPAKHSHGSSASIFPLDDGSNPFFIAEFDSLDDDPEADSWVGGLTRGALSMGALECSLQCSFLAHLWPLVDQLLNGKATSQSHISVIQADNSGLGESQVSFEEKWNQVIESGLNKCHSLLSSIVPQKIIQFSALVDSPKVTLWASGVELHTHQQQGIPDTGQNKYLLQPNFGVTVVASLGCLGLVMWPAVREKGASNDEVKYDCGEAAGQQNDTMKQWAWLQKPPCFPSNSTATVHSEHEKFGNNLLVSVEGLGMSLEMTDHLNVLPLVGPVTFTIESSLCWDQFSSLFKTHKYLSAAASGRMSLLTVYSYNYEVFIVSQVVGYYVKAIQKNLILNQSSDIDWESQLKLSVEPKEEKSNMVSDNKPFSSKEVPFSAGFHCEFEVDGVQMVFGDVRCQQGLLCENEIVDQAALKRKEGRYHCESIEEGMESSGEQVYRNWVNGTDLEVELYVFLQGIFLSFSLNSASQACISAGFRRFFMRLADPTKASSTKHLSDLSNKLLRGLSASTNMALNNTDFESISSSVRSEFSLEHFTLTANRPSFPSDCREEEMVSVRQVEVNFKEKGGTTSQGRESALKQMKPLQTCNFSVLNLDLTQISDEKASSHVSGINTKSITSDVSQEDKVSLEQGHLNQSNIAGSTSKRDSECWLSCSAEMGTLAISDGVLDAFVTKVMNVASGTATISVEVCFGKGPESITIHTEGGLVIVHTEALVTLLDFSRKYSEVLLKATSLFLSNKESQRDHFSSEKGGEPMVFNPSYMSRSSSLPLPQATDTQQLKYRRLHSAPHSLISPGTMTSLPAVKKSSSFEGIIAIKISGFSLGLAKHICGGGEAEGMLLELEVSANSEVGAITNKASIFLSRFAIGCLKSRVAGKTKYQRTSSKSPQFYSSFRKVSEDDSGMQQEEGPPTQHRASSSASDSNVISKKDRGSLSDKLDKGSNIGPPTGVGDLKRSLPERSSFILECLSGSFAIKRVPTSEKVWKWTNAWQGIMSISGLDVAITTSEIQLLTSLFAPLYGLKRSSQSKDLETAAVALSQGSKAELEFDIQDGSIIAIKDVREHLYLAVEEIPSKKGQYHLVGVLHYTLVGDRALFKVKYQDAHNKDSNSVSWFSLLSLHAKNADGEPFRVHYRSGFALADISSTNDRSWELWRCIRADTATNEDHAELNVCSTKSRNMFHFVNQKGKSSLSLVDAVPLMVKPPGNPFKVKVLATPPTSVPDQLADHAEAPITIPPCDDEEVVSMVTSIPQVKCEFDGFTLTILHEAAGGMHLLPLLRGQIQNTNGVVQAGHRKMRAINECKILFEYFEAQSCLWVPIVNPIATEFFYRARVSSVGAAVDTHKKTPFTIFVRLSKVDLIVSEPSLDTCLFLVGALELAGPYTVKHSPVQANSCLVENQTGVELVSRFDQHAAKMDGLILPRQSDSFLVRHTTSRRDSDPAKVASSMELYLQKQGRGTSSAVLVSLADPGVIAVRTRLEAAEGRQLTAPGPIVVVDISRKSQDGILVTVSPMVRIHNASGLALDLRCRRSKQGGDGAVVMLEDGDVVDDSMGAFDAINVQGELRKALASFNVGNFLLSVRPAAKNREKSESSSERENTGDDAKYDWSEDIQGLKSTKLSGLFEKLQYSFKRSIKYRNLDSSFGLVFCPAKIGSSDESSNGNVQHGCYFMIRTTSRNVPISTLKSTKEQQQGQQQQQGMYKEIAWQEQKEIMLLPTIRVHNLLSSSVTVKLLKSFAGKQETLKTQQPEYQATIDKGGKASVYANLGTLFLVVKHDDLGLVSKPVCLGLQSREFSEQAKDGNLQKLEIPVDFGDDIHYGLSLVTRGEDGVMKVVLFTRYVLHNDSHAILLCCSPSQQRWGFGYSKDQNLEWPISSPYLTLKSFSRTSWFERSTKLLFKRTEKNADVTALDFESFSGSMEIGLRVFSENGVGDRIQLGVTLHPPSADDSNPSYVVRLVPRYLISNESDEAVMVCQDGLQGDANLIATLQPKERVALRAQILHDKGKETGGNPLGKSKEAGPELLLSVRFRPKETGWNWSGPVCVAALGSFSLKIRSENGFSRGRQQDGLWFAVADVCQESSSLVTCFRKQAAEAIPYRIENALFSTSILYNQQSSGESEVLDSGDSVGYVWDDLSLPHKLTIKVAGTSLRHDINVDKLRAWKSFRPSRSKKGFSLHNILHELQGMALYGDDGSNLRNESGLPNIGYEVYADGPTRVLRVCEDVNCVSGRSWQSEITSPKSQIEFRVPIFTMTLVDLGKQSMDPTQVDNLPPSKDHANSPIVSARVTNMLVEASVTPEYTLCQLKVERLDIDVKWQGAPIAAILRVYGQDRFSKGHTVLHMAAVVSNQARNPIQLKYASILLQAMELNLDEDTLMKLASFYRSSLAESNSPSRRIYFDRFEIHPIKIIGTFLPGKPRADYTSGQETLRGLLHSVIKIPSVRGATVELNGVLLSNALLTYKQLALKCAQHYSWYAMRAIYIARGSKLLPPGFASLFDDSAASSLDVFFDPSNGSIDLQGLTLGMFSLLSRGLRKKGNGGTQRYLGDLEHTVKAAGSNLLFAVVTEVSDCVLKGADTNGFDGIVNGFRRGILNAAMKPSVLRSAVVQGGATRRIKLDRIIGTQEAYVEGYLQATLDVLYKQDYLRVKVQDDMVVLKNLPPNTALMEEIMECVKNFLIGEGLISGDSTVAAIRSLKRLQGETERRVGPAVVALCEQLLVIVVVRALRRQVVKVMRAQFGDDVTHIIPQKEGHKEEAPVEQEEPKKPETSKGGILGSVDLKKAVGGFLISSAFAYADGRLCRHIPNPLIRRIVSGFLLSFVE